MHEISGANQPQPNKPRPSGKFRRAIALIGAAIAGTLSATTTVQQLDRARHTVETEMKAAAQQSAPAAASKTPGGQEVTYVAPTRRLRRMGLKGPMPVAKESVPPKMYGQYLQSRGRQKWTKSRRA